jgi:hypothetical protein
MSISHWGFFPGLMTVREPSYAYAGWSLAVWEPCDFNRMVQWL